MTSEERVKLPDVEVEVFRKLVEYAYRGDYSEQDTDAHSGNRSLVDQGENDTERKYRAENEEGRNLFTRWLYRSYIPDAIHHAGSRVPSRFHNDKRDLPLVGYDAALMLHAKLYRLAERYGVPLLKKLAMQKLHNLLKGLD